MACRQKKGRCRACVHFYTRAHVFFFFCQYKYRTARGDTTVSAAFYARALAVPSTDPAKYRLEDRARFVWQKGKTSLSAVRFISVIIVQHGLYRAAQANGLRKKLKHQLSGFQFFYSIGRVIYNPCFLSAAVNVFLRQTRN